MQDQAIRLRDLSVPAMWAVLSAGLLAYAVGFDQGMLLSPVTDALASSGGVLHELFHDARHLLGVPCH
jgi:hypothetical protein